MAIRSGFSSKLGFVAAAAGSAVGLGNIWKFPFEVGEGGGAAFVLMYLMFCFLLCFPIMVTEIAIGRRTQRNPVGAFKEMGYPGWSFIGKLGIITGVLILSFYNVVAGWAFGYFIEMLMGNFNIGSQFADFITNVFKIGGYAIMFMLATAFIVSKGIAGGIEKAAKILMPTLIVIILALVIYSLTLEGALPGLSFYLVPDFSKIDLNVVYSALGQAFFSLSLGMGALITYGSYLGRNDNIISSAVLITLADVGIAFIAGLMMFPLVSFVAYSSPELIEGIKTGIPAVAAAVEQNPEMSPLDIFLMPEAGNAGAGLIFVTLPGAFASLGPTLGIVIGSVFFLLLSFAALTSTVSLLEVPVAYLVDEYEIRRKRAVWIMAAIIFIVGIPSLVGNGYSAFFTNFISYFGQEGYTDFMTFVGHVANDSFLPLGGFLISVFAAYVWKKERLYDEISRGNPGFVATLTAKYLDIALRFICPVILGIIFMLTVLDRFLGISLVG